MRLSDTDDDGRHRRKRGASGMLAARVTEVQLRVVWNRGNLRLNNDLENHSWAESLVKRRTSRTGSPRVNRATRTHPNGTWSLI